MDILKVLSRGIKQAPRPGGQTPAPAAAQLPSAGSKPNPQIYHLSLIHI